MVAFVHCAECCLKTCNQFVDTECLRDTSLPTIVEHLTRDEATAVVTGDDRTLRDVSLTASIFYYFIENTMRKALDTLSLTKYFEILFVLQFE